MFKINWALKVHMFKKNWTLKVHMFKINWTLKVYLFKINWALKVHMFKINWALKGHMFKINWALKGHMFKIQKLMRFQRRLYRICTACFLVLPCIWFTATVNCFYAKSLNKPFKYFIQCKILKLDLESSYFESFLSSLQSHPLWVTLYLIA